MFSFLNKGSAPGDVKTIRQEVLLHIKDRLRKAEGGEGSSISALRIFVAAGADNPLYEAALYTAEPKKMRAEVQRLADDFAIDLPKNWNLETLFVEELPLNAAKAERMPLALGIVAGGLSDSPKKNTAAILRVLSGAAEQTSYRLVPGGGRVYIGRDKTAQGSDGFFRENTIAFPSSSEADGNRYVSRSHAHVEWDAGGACFCLKADEGGIPPRNKTKVQRADGEVVRLQTTEIGHRLEPGDQIVLGESVTLAFDYLTEQS